MQLVEFFSLAFYLCRFILFDRFKAYLYSSLVLLVGLLLYYVEAPYWDCFSSSTFSSLNTSVLGSSLIHLSLLLCFFFIFYFYFIYVILFFLYDLAFSDSWFWQY